VLQLSSQPVSVTDGDDGRDQSRRTLARRPQPVPTGVRLFRRYGSLLGPLIGGYLLFDRAFAYIHIPGTPLYVGECMLLLGLLAAVLQPGFVRRAFAEETLITLVVGFMFWGLCRSVPELKHYGIDTVRDSALWYYGLFAVLVVAAVMVRPELPGRLVRQFSRFIPLLLIWLPFALVIPRVKDIPVNVPFSQVTVLNHKPGNVAVAASIALVFLWLVPNARRSVRSRNILSVLALATIALDGTQNRGGFGAAGVGILIALVFIPIRWRLVGRILLVAVVGLTVGLLAAFQVQTGGAGKLGQGRAISASQLISNVASVGGVQTGGNLQATVAFRDRLWTQVYAKEIRSGKLPYGFGFGPNLAVLAGLPEVAANNPVLELRSPHNSHLDVLARMGVIGLVLWATIWLLWLKRMLVARRRMANRGDTTGKGVVEACIAAVGAILVNAFFDPTLEGAQVACLLWTIFGLGVVLSGRMYSERTLRVLRRATQPESDSPRRQVAARLGSAWQPLDAKERGQLQSSRRALLTATRDDR
jgi:hypothetical protein